MFPHCKLKESDLASYFPGVTREMVMESLAKDKVAFSDFLNFISPAAAGLMKEMRNAATRIKHRYFGNTVRLYAPLYVSNYCINNCVYCAFKSEHRTRRRRLSIEEIVEEAKIIKGFGMDSLLLVSGEDPKSMSVDFLAEAVRKLRELFYYVSLEIYPMDATSYRQLFEAGVHGLTLYQETYQEDLYRSLHPSGPKSDYSRRLWHVEQGAKAGFYNVGLGVLLGLYDWRTEMVSLAAHGLWLRKKYWQTKIQFSFPRITPIPGGFHVPNPVGEDELEQIMLAFRLYFHEADLFISTRESNAFRNRVAESCASHVSAGSQVVPGGYRHAKDREEELGQFMVNDGSSAGEVDNAFRHKGIEVIYKDWDACIGM